MQACCCDQGFSGLAGHTAVSPVLGFSITKSRAQPNSKTLRLRRRRPPNAIPLLPGRPRVVRICIAAYSLLPEIGVAVAAASLSGRFHQPPPRLWNRITVSEKRE